MVVAEKRDKTLCVLITGASRGIGLELVKQYLLRVGRGNYGRGGHVIACARDPDKSMDLLRCFTVDYVSYELVPLDVTDPGSFGDLHEHLQDLDRIKEMDGVAQKIDIVFNNAGAGGAFGPITEQEVEAWDQTFAILVRSVFLGTKHGARVMIKTALRESGQAGGCAELRDDS